MLLALCRAKYAGVLTWQGRWEEAEHELDLAVAGLAASRPPMVGEALVRLAMLRQRQGRATDAEDLLARCEGDARALLVRAALAFSRCRPAEAAEWAERFLRRYPEAGRIERHDGLELVVRAYAEMGDGERADEALDELRDIAERAKTRPLRAAVLAAEAKVAASRSDHDRARRSLEDALDLLALGGMPYEAALVRLDLAAALAALGRHDVARRQVEVALATFQQLGATSGVDRAEAELRRLQRRAGPSGTTFEGPLGVLSPREREVLALVADGLTNAVIAARLAVSEHTIHRHVTSILRKLSLPSRAAAATLAARHGLV
jgi:LuxR family transcriptional regulator, maltose regulon positive regulatory protein